MSAAMNKANREEKAEQLGYAEAKEQFASQGAFSSGITWDNEAEMNEAYDRGVNRAETEYQNTAQVKEAGLRTELSFDGCGINGPDEYRTRLATFNRTPDFTAAVIHRYGNLFAAAPELLEACKEMNAATLAGGPYDIDKASVRIRAAIERAEGRAAK